MVRTAGRGRLRARWIARARVLRGMAAAGAAAAIVATGLPAGATADVPHVLVYSGTEGFRHLSIPHAKDVLRQAAARSGAFTVELSEDPQVLTTETLERVDAVVWLSSTGSESPFSDEQEAAYVEWMRCGGGHVGVHASADSWKTGWPEWVEVTGAFIAGHPLTATSIADDQFKDPDGMLVEGWGEPEARVDVADTTHPATAPWAGQDSVRLRDEYYWFDRDPADVMADFNALLTFGGFTDPVEAAVWGSRFPQDMPVAWTGSFRGRNRTFYTNLGHSIGTWNNRAFVDHVVAGLLWTTAAPRPEDCDRPRPSAASR
jgi:type 1 glutamine amidotransferase